MSPNEFDRWWSDVKLRFPSVESWLCKVHPAIEMQTKFLLTWRTALLESGIADALEVNRLMQSGDLPWVGEYDADKERLPQHVRRLARQLAWDRQDRTDDEPHTELSPTAFPAGKILRRILELTAKGMPREQAKEIVLAELPVGSPSYEPRFHCAICCDTGFITVASQTAMEMMLSGRFDMCHHRSGAMLCSCKGHLPQNPKRPPRAVYDPALDFKIEDFCWREPEVERFMEWCEAKRNEYWERRRHSEFDQFNQREFAK